MCFDGEKRLAHIRGKMRKKVWINQGDIVLLSLRDFQDDKADVIQKYSSDEAPSSSSTASCPRRQRSTRARPRRTARASTWSSSTRCRLTRMTTTTTSARTTTLTSTTSRVLLPRDRRLCSSVVSPPAPARLFVRL